MISTTVVVIAMMLMACDGQPLEEPEFESIPFALPCDPENLPETIPGCKVCDPKGFRDCCLEVKEKIACMCMNPTGEYQWYIGVCRN